MEAYWVRVLKQEDVNLEIDTRNRVRGTFRLGNEIFTVLRFYEDREFFLCRKQNQRVGLIYIYISNSWLKQLIDVNCTGTKQILVWTRRFDRGSKAQSRRAIARIFKKFMKTYTPE